jgi:hypothetical protein
LEPLVRSNLADFQAFTLCVDYLEQVIWRETVLAEHVTSHPLDHNATSRLIQSIAERDRRLAYTLNKDWDAGRFPDASAKLEAVYDLQPKDQLLFQWNRAAAYSARLAKDPDHFYQIMQTAFPA